MARAHAEATQAVDRPRTRGAARSETARQRARKDEILQAAKCVLVEEGHHRLTLRNVAEKVGIKLASLQYHFPNKSDLITALIDAGNDTYQGLVASLNQVIDSSPSDEAVAAILDRVFEEYQDERALSVHEQLWALSVRDPEMMERYLKGYSEVWDSAVAVIGRFDPESTEDERRTRAALIIALVDGLEAFLSAEQLRRQLPDSMKESVSKLIKSIARGET